MIDAGAERPLLRYQREYLADRAPWKCLVKARRAGGTFVVALETAAAAAGFTFDDQGDIAEYDPALGVDQRITSASETQACDFLSETTAHLDRLSAIAGAEIVDKASSSRVQLRNGATLRACAPSPRSIRGPGADLVLDEAGVLPEPAQLWQAAHAIAGRTPARPQGYRVRACGTPLGDDEANVLWSAARGRLAQRFSTHTVDIHRAIADGHPADVAEIREEVGSELAFLEEYECSFQSARARLISETLYDQALYAELPAPGKAQPRYGGYDVARSARGDAAALMMAIAAEGALWAYAPELRRGLAWDAQETWVSGAIKGAARFAIDSTSIGSMLAERLTTKHGGPTRILSLNFSSGTDRERVYSALQTAFDRRMVRVPRDGELRRAVLSLRREITGHGNVRYVLPRTKAGHGDAAIALGLALVAWGRVSQSTRPSKNVGDAPHGGRGSKDSRNAATMFGGEMSAEDVAGIL